MTSVNDDGTSNGQEPQIERLNLAVPANIHKLKQWLMWKYEPAARPGDKDRKVPYYANNTRRRGEQGGQEDRARLVTFDEAIAALRSGVFTGVGIALLEGSPLNALDFDACVENGVVAPEIRMLYTEAATYAELSPSGRGVRVLGFGDIASQKRIHPQGWNVEAFGATGFVTITGHRLTPNDVEPWTADVKRKLLLWLSNENNDSDRPRGEQLDQVRATDIIYQALKSRGVIKNEKRDGRVNIHCPFEAEHTSGAGHDDTTYFLPQTHGYAHGHFKCLHAHCAERTDADFRSAIGVASPIFAFLERKADTDDGPFVPADVFASHWSPTEYVLEGILQRGYLHALTGHSNAGKTAISLKMAVCVALGIPFGTHACAQGKVVYLAGENPDDVRSRLIALCQDMRIDINELGKWLFVLPMAFPLAQSIAVLKDEIARLGDVSLIVIDTRAAYAGAEDENDNAQAMVDARAQRELTTVPGRPAVLVPNHPTHSAVAPNMRPRGGSSYYGEIDVNLNVWNSSGIITLTGEKMRGAPFEPLTISLRQFTLLGYAQRTADGSGAPIVSIVVDVTTDAQAKELAQATESDENLLLAAIDLYPKGTLRELADACGWHGGKNKVGRLLKQLKQDKLVREYRRNLLLTEIGKRELSVSRTSAIGKRSES